MDSSSLEADMYDGEPVQIMYYGEAAENPGEEPHNPNSRGKKRKLVFHRDRAEAILGTDEKRPVAVISVVGATKQGKSFWLTYLLRYLWALENKHKTGVEGDWMDLPLQGFPFGHDESTRTQGMWMWSRPFHLVNEETGFELDVLVMDTQGIFDRGHSNKEYCITVGLSLLVSSCFIFNVMTGVNEEVLQLLHKFLSFSRITKDAIDDPDVGQNDPDQINEAPFQKLVFLVRDWNIPMDFPYGSAGGQNFVQDVLSYREKDDLAGQSVRQEIQKSFNEINCCLLPHPGQHFLHLQNLTGDQLEDLFKEKLRESIETLVNLENLKDFHLCQINGQPLTAPEVISALQIAVDHFNSQTIPTPDSTHEVTINFFRKIIIDRIVNQYKRDMKFDDLNCDRENSRFYFKDHLTHLHETARDSARNTLKKESRRIISASHSFEDLSSSLGDKIETVYKTLQEKNELIHRRSLGIANEKARELYLNELAVKCKDVKFRKIEDFYYVANRIKTGALKCFEQLFKFYPNEMDPKPREFKKELQKFKKILTEETERLILEHKISEGERCC